MESLRERFNMIIVHIFGGLGNQMFQYAFGLSKNVRSNGLLKLDLSAFENYKLRKFELNSPFKLDYLVSSIYENQNLKSENKFQKILKKFGFKESSYIKEKEFSFSDKIYSIRSGYFEGYWQSPKYFIENERAIRDAFRFRDDISENAEKYLKKIQDCYSVSLHVRRGDYVSNKSTNIVHGTCSIDFYCQAVHYLESKFLDTTFFVFSDDLEWAKQNLAFIKKKVFVEKSVASRDWEEMFLMSKCKSHIIANSSFSWWGAWLNNSNDKIVIAPQKWFSDESIDVSDLFPKEWILM
jgi:hypothetical protein